MLPSNVLDPRFSYKSDDIRRLFLKDAVEGPYGILEGACGGLVNALTEMCWNSTRGSEVVEATHHES